MLLPGILRLALILRMLRCAVIRMTFVVNLLMIPAMMMLVLVIPVVVVVPASSVMPPLGMAIPIGMLTTPMAVALLWVTIAVTEIRVVFRMIVTVVVTLGMA